MALRGRLRSVQSWGDRLLTSLSGSGARPFAGRSTLQAEHGQLVTQDEYLGVLREGAHPVGRDESEQSADEPVEEREGHGRAAWSSASELVKSDM
jgi:hypothetical protein